MSFDQNFNSELKKINRSFADGEVPPQFDFANMLNTNSFQNIDMEKLKYNAFFRSYENMESKIPSALSSLPGFEEIVEMNQPSYDSPLDELISKETKKE